LGIAYGKRNIDNSQEGIKIECEVI
jgi:hypothetical protein